MRTLLSLSSALAIASAHGALAQSDEFYPLGTILFTSGSGNEVGIDSEDLDRTDPADLQDVFKNEPTISVGSSLPVSQKIYVNGVEENNLAVTVDGARQNNKIFHHNATTLIDPELLKQVRVDPGVAPADAGPGALAGAIAFETKDVDDLLEAGRSFGGIVSGEYQSNGDIFTNSLSVFGRQGAFEALGYLKYAEGGTREDGNGDEIIGSGTGLLSGLAKFAYQGETGHRFELSYESVHDDEARPYRADIGRLVGGRPVPDTRTYDLRRQNLVFTYTDEAPTGWWDPKFSLAYSVTDLLLPEADQESRGSTDSISGVFQNRFPVAYGSVTAGADFYVETAETDYRYLPDSSFDEAASEEARNVGIFAQARLDVTQSARLSFGGRVDFQEFEGTDGTTYTNQGLSGNISGEYDLTEAITVSAGVSRVWGGVVLAENFIMNPAWVYPGDSIEPVSADNLFLAADASFGRFDFRGKVFRTNINDARVPSYGGGPDATSDVEAQGFELGATYNWQNGFFRVGYANIDSEIDGTQADSYTGRYLTTPIGELITVEIAHKLSDMDLMVGVDAQIALEKEETYNFGDPTVPLPAYEVVNAFVEYTPRAVPNFTIRGEINNIFDEVYADRATYGQEFRDDGLTPLYEPGRNIAIRGTFTF
ncbi:TonB-dependent receptor domain-containing protein [Algicella marina]|uniref:TonB-dependent receptor plug domain-containing protein n=1 Tax=Algicella marina TaxID=2683284 RepID=A0A6P1T1X8_9RHOB|nr:TonB-dependent receptor [Algicella marina]QHQ35289.1 TonB-dependent receptor plug domain-containing protein [Algicella marina]